jgi:hypothetical protein
MHSSASDCGLFLQTLEVEHVTIHAHLKFAERTHTYRQSVNDEISLLCATAVGLTGVEVVEHSMIVYPLLATDGCMISHQVGDILVCIQSQQDLVNLKLHKTQWNPLPQRKCWPLVSPELQKVCIFEVISLTETDFDIEIHRIHVIINNLQCR